MNQFAKSMHVMEFFLTPQMECQFWVRLQKLKICGQLLQFGLKKVQEQQSLWQSGWFLEIQRLICMLQISRAFMSTIRKKNTLNLVWPNHLIRLTESFIHLSSMNLIVKCDFLLTMSAKLPLAQSFMKPLVGNAHSGMKQTRI